MASLRQPATQVAAAAIQRSSPLAVRMPWADTTRGYAQISRDKINRAMSHQQKLGERGATKEQTISQMQKSAAMDVFKDGGGPLFPGTIPPQFPKKKKKKNQLALLKRAKEEERAEKKKGLTK